MLTLIIFMIFIINNRSYKDCRLFMEIGGNERSTWWFIYGSKNDLDFSGEAAPDCDRHPQ
jgi:hypothetical protein